MQFVDQSFARRLESAEEIPQVDCARMLQKLRPEIGADFAPICGGHMMFAGLNSPIGHAAGLGFDGPVTAADLDRLEAFYRSHNAPAQLDICPLTDPSVLELVSGRGYSMLELNNVLYRPIDSQEKFEIAKGIEIRRSNPAEAAFRSASPSSRPPTASPSPPPPDASFPNIGCLRCSARARCPNFAVAEFRQPCCAPE